MIQIQLNQKELTRWLNALAKVEVTSKLWIEDKIQSKMAIDYYQLLTKNILSGKYARGWTYNERYREWKQENFPGRGFWRLKGDLLRSLTTWKDGKEGYRSGVLPGTYDSGGKSWLGSGNRGKFKEVGMYGWIMEKGGDYGRGGKHPKRPQFKPTMDEYAVDGHPKRGEEALEVIGAQWS